MAPEMQFSIAIDNGSVVTSIAADVAWMNQATWRHCRFGSKPAPAQPRRGDPGRYRDFGPEKEGDN